MLYVVLMALVLWPDRAELPDGTVFALLLTAAEICFLIQRHKKRKKQKNADLMACFYAGILLWEILTDWLFMTDPILIPSPRAVAGVFLTQRRLMGRGIFSSLKLLAIGFGTAFLTGIPLGIITGRVKRLKEFFIPIAKVACCVPPIIYTPYVVALMPSFRAASVFVIVMGLFWPVFMNVVLQVSSMPQTMEDTVKSMQVGKRDLLFGIYLPYLLPGVVKSLHVSLSTSFMLLTMAEMMGASSGLGYFIKNFADYGNYTSVLAGIILTAAVILVLNRLLEAAERRCIRWTM